MNDSSKTPLLLVACGSFSPITYLHLRMFEMAADYAKYNTDFEVIGGYLSPVSDAYRKAGMKPAISFMLLNFVLRSRFLAGMMANTRIVKVL